jgi:hypothetical protein
VEVQDLLEFKLVIPIKTVHNFLKDRDALSLLHHDLIAIATRDVAAYGKSREEIAREVRGKDEAIKLLSQSFASDKITPEEIELVLYSIGDNHAFLTGTRYVCDVAAKIWKKKSASLRKRVQL